MLAYLGIINLLTIALVICGSNGCKYHCVNVPEHTDIMVDESNI